MVEDDAREYKVVVNREGQYSLWLAHRENPCGWHDAGQKGTKRQCLDYINAVWVDMRPLSLRTHMRASS